MSKNFGLAPTRLLQRLASRLMTAFVLSVLFVPGVLAQDITTEFDDSADFAKFKTFAIRDGQLNNRHPALSGELVKKRIETEIQSALTAKGLTLATGPADLNVFYQFGAARRVETESYPVGWRGLGTRVVRVPYSEGTLVIDLRDTATRSLVWRGIATEGERDPTKLAGKLDDMVKKSLAKYPPKK
jgi:hypothetical protein